MPRVRTEKQPEAAGGQSVCRRLASVMTALVVWRLLDLLGVESRARSVLAVFAGGLFLLHPLQTESVAYVASRSEPLATMTISGRSAATLDGVAATPRRMSTCASTSCPSR